jgi:hypothetical protein
VAACLDYGANAVTLRNPLEDTVIDWPEVIVHPCA